MKSPTSSILQSIKSLKTKLRSDHLELQGLRRDFAMGPTRPIIQIQQRQESPIFNNFKSNKSLEKNARTKLLQIRKNHQIQIKGLHQKYKMQKEQIADTYQQKIQELTKFFEQKISQQNVYITMLEQQTQRDNNIEQITVPKPILTMNTKVYELNLNQVAFHDKINFELFAEQKNAGQNNSMIIQRQPQDETKKYQQIVNNLLKQNATLLQSVQTLKMENRRLMHSTLLDGNYKLGSDKQNLSEISKKQNRSNQPQTSRQYFSVMPLSAQQNINQSLYRHSCQTNKNRLKFSKAACDKSRKQSERSFTSMINNENINMSNIQLRNANSIQKSNRLQDSIVQQQEQSIMSEEMKLRTIKHFVKAISHRSTQCEEHIESYLVPKVPTKKGVGIRNALKNISAL